MVKTPRKPTASTLDTFVRPTPSPSNSTNSLKRASATTPATSSTKKKQKKVAASGKKSTTVKRKRKPLVQDNRNLGTLELLDTTDEDEATISKVVAAVTNASKEDSSKGKAKLVLEEEDWMMDGNDDVNATKRDGEAKEATESGRDSQSSKREESTASDTKEGSSPVASTSKAIMLDEPVNETKSNGEAELGKTPARTDFFKEEPIRARRERSSSKDKGKGKAKETIELSSDDDDDDLAVSGGLTCPMCKVDLETLPVKKRNSHVGSCLDSIPSAKATPETPSEVVHDSKPSLLQRGLLAPISRLFSRQPSSSSTKPPKSAPSATSTKQPLTSALPNAFTALMAGHAESSQWKEADQASQQKGRLPKGTDRKVPFYKWIDGMEITVDAFRYGKIEGCKGYFLSHAHSDHYQNLSSSWQHGPIYCSLTTANLIKLKLKVEDKWIIPLPLDETVKVQGIDVTLIDANHCPGSVLFLFEGPHTDPKSPYSKTPSRIFRHLHCGDFRASPAHILHPSMSLPTPPPSSIASLLPAALRGKTPKKLDSIYLDTTYLAPSYCFPAQELVISACADLVKERVVEGREEALWRADGREGERKGIKGWLKGTGGEVKEEGDEVKGEEDNEEMMAVEMLDGLPEENEDEGDGLGGEETMALEGEADMSNEYDGEDDGEEWKMIREMESQAQTPREGTIEPTGYFETGDFRGGDESQGLEEVPTLPEEQAEQDLEFQLDNAVKPEEKMEEDSKVELKPKVERDDEEEAEVKPVLEGDDSKPELKVDIKDEKLELKPKTERLLVMIGTYSIGKERIVKAIAHALSTKIYADPRKKELFLAQDDPDLHSLITDDPLEAQVHVGWLSSIAREAMLEYLAKYKAPRCPGGFNKMIGLRPTGWTYRSESKDKFPSIPKILALEQARKFSPAGLYPQRDSTPQCMAFGVPYSEHSSFFELTCFCLSLDYVRIIPTVNVHNVNSRNKMKEWIDRWAAEKKRRQDARMPKIVPYRNENYW